MSDWNTAIITEFRANGGRVGGPFEGGDLLLHVLWDRVVGAMPGYADYQRQTDRVVPVVVLARAD